MYDRALGTLGAAGGGLLGAMGRALEPLDYPRQSLWNLPGKLAEGDFAAALPGLMGLGAGGLAAATGLGLPAAIGIGSLVGGGLQGVGLQSNPEAFAAPTPEDVTGSDNVLLNMLVGAAGDPLTYAGGFGGRKAGLKAGNYLEDAALARGPLYSTDENKLLAALGNQTGWGEVGPRIEAMKASPYWEDILRELPDEPMRIASGAEATVGIPMNDPQAVVRIGGGPSTLDVRRDFAKQGMGSIAPDVRPNIPPMLQPARSVEIGPYRVEHLPYMETLGSKGAVGQAMRDSSHPFRQALAPLEDEIAASGMSPADMHPGNVGRVPGSDRFFVTDPGNAGFVAGVTPVGVISGAAGIPSRTPPGPFLSKILDLIDGGKASRAAIERDLAKAIETGGVTFPGSGAPIPQPRPAMAPAWAQGGARLDGPNVPWNVPPNSESLQAAVRGGVGTFGVEAAREERNNLINAIMSELQYGRPPERLRPLVDDVAMRQQDIDAALLRAPRGVPTPLLDQLSPEALAEIASGRRPNVDLLELIQSLAAQPR